MSALSGIPRDLLERAAQMPENEGARQVIERELRSRARPSTATARAVLPLPESEGAPGAFRLAFPLPRVELQPNARTHWRPRADLTAEYRALVGRMARSSLRETPLWPRATTSAVFHLPHAKHDADNLAAWLKPLWDGLADAGVVKNDRGLTHSAPVVVVDREHCGVVITVTPLQTDEGARG